MHFLKYLVVVILLGGTTCDAEAREGIRYDWPLFIYNFGGLDGYSIEEQVGILQHYGYDGMTISIEKAERLDQFNQYIATAESFEDFKIYSAFYRFNYDETTGFSDDWKPVIDRLAKTDTDFWLIFGKKREVFTPEVIERQIREVVDYAAEKNVKVTLYPHSKDAIPTAEEALVYVEKINSPNLDLAVHTCHEIRAGNADRIEDVLEKVKDRLGYVTIAGSDNIPNLTNGSEWEYSTLKPLYRGNFEMMRVLKTLKALNYEGSIGFINHRISEAPEFYLPLSKSTYDGWIETLNAAP